MPLWGLMTPWCTMMRLVVSAWTSSRGAKSIEPAPPWTCSRCLRCSGSRCPMRWVSGGLGVLADEVAMAADNRMASVARNDRPMHVKRVCLMHLLVRRDQDPISYSIRNEEGQKLAWRSFRPVDAGILAFCPERGRLHGPYQCVHCRRRHRPGVSTRPDSARLDFQRIPAVLRGLPGSGRVAGGQGRSALSPGVGCLVVGDIHRPDGISFSCRRTSAAAAIPGTAITGRRRVSDLPGGQSVRSAVDTRGRAGPGSRLNLRRCWGGLRAHAAVADLDQLELWLARVVRFLCPGGCRRRGDLVCRCARSAAGAWLGKCCRASAY